jgi:arylsulfatase A-like enzyme
MRPNILFIMSDDHAANAISCYGAGLNRTPHLDRLADEGMRLDRCYVTNSICTPSRASILTGTYNHVNCVTTLDTHIDNRLPNVAKHLKAAGYATAIFGKWHLGEGAAHQPTGFDEWSVLPGQGEYFNPEMIGPGGPHIEKGYATDIITDKCIDYLKRRDASRPFFLMCHHKAPHRPFVPHPRYAKLFADEGIPFPPTFEDDYANRAKAAFAAKMRIREDMTYEDLGLIQPEGGDEVGEPVFPGWTARKVPDPEDVGGLKLVDRETGETYTFNRREDLHRFKYQRYLKRYLRTIAGIDDNVGRLLDALDAAGLAENTLVIYTSDQGFFLGEHGWFDKRFMYEESLKMPFLVRYPKGIKGGSVSRLIATNVDFAPTFLDYAGAAIPSYMQGVSLRPLFEGGDGAGWQDVAYHRYWMHKDAIHNAFAHYGVRDARYKLIYWYNDPLGQAGANAGDEPPEWELFDCEKDPLELVNVAGDPAYADVFAAMLAKLDAKMAEIGDVPEHDSRTVLAARRPAGGPAG